MSENNFGGEDRIAHINCRRARETPRVDGNPDKTFWKNAEKSRRFVDIVNGEQAFFDTRIAALYVAFWIEEPAPRASLTERDSLVWFDNDVEVFLTARTVITNSR